MNNPCNIEISSVLEVQRGIISQLNALAEARNVTRSEIANAIGVSKPVISRAFSNDYDKTMNLRTLMALCEAAGATLHLGITPK